MNSGKIFAAELDKIPVLKFVGDVRVLMSSTLENYFSSLYRHEDLDAVLIDLTDTRGIDSTTLGLLAKMAIRLKKQFGIRPTIVSTNPNITRILQSMNFGAVCLIIDEPLTRQAQFGELERIEESEEKVRRRVIEAHQALMGLSEENRQQFKDLVNALKKGH